MSQMRQPSKNCCSDWMCVKSPLAATDFSSWYPRNLCVHQRWLRNPSRKLHSQQLIHYRICMLVWLLEVPKVVFLVRVEYGRRQLNSEVSVTNGRMLCHWASYRCYSTNVLCCRCCGWCCTLAHARAHTHTHTTVLLLFWNLSGSTQVSRYQKGKTRKVKTHLHLLEQEIVSGSGICWAICKSAPHPRQQRQHPTTQFSTGRMPLLPPNQQRQRTVR